ncbi:MAG: histidinol dehydrogenase [Candidatus Bathyarchaeia archaeon]
MKTEDSGTATHSLTTTSQDIAGEVVTWIKEIAGSTERSDIVQQALAAHGFIITCSSIDEMVRLANIFAPEHLEIMTRNPQALANKISSAGLILIGAYSPVALSDYGSGTNHVLPTGGFGHVYSGLSALDFTRRVSIVESSKEGLAVLENHVKVLTEAEKLPNHYKAVAARVKK